MEKVILNWTNHHKGQGLGSKVKIPKTTQALRESQIFSQENRCWRDLLVRFVQAKSLEQGPEFTKSSLQPKAHCSPAALLLQSPTGDEMKR